jgi:hypothetical protein
MPASTAKASSALLLTLVSDREFVMTRVFDAPRVSGFRGLDEARASDAVVWSA